MKIIDSSFLKKMGWVCVGAMLCVWVSWKGFKPKKETAAVRYKTFEPISLPNQKTFESDQFENPKEMLFALKGDPGQNLKLHFSPGNIENKKDVAIYFNGQKVGFAKPCLGFWGKEQRMTLKEEWFEENNVLRFSYQNKQGPKSVWAVRQIYFSFPKKKNEMFLSADQLKSALHLIAHANEEPGNLSRAELLLQNILAEQSGGKKEKIKIEKLLEDIFSEKKKIFSMGLKQLETYRRHNKLSAFEKEYRKLMKVFFVKEDPFRLEIQEKADLLSKTELEGAS